jgi:hypothetical protein
VVTPPLHPAHQDHVPANVPGGQVPASVRTSGCRHICQILIQVFYPLFSRNASVLATKSSHCTYVIG